MIYRKHPIRSLLTSMLRKASIRYPSKSIKGSNYGEFLKDKNVLLCTRLYKYAPNLESLLTQQYVCVMCTLWSDNTCVFTRFHSVKNANTQLIWSSDTYKLYILQYNRVGLRVWCLMPLSRIFQLYRGGQFYWWRKPEYPEKNHWPTASHW